jgi:hypothetical protein
MKGDVFAEKLTIGGQVKDTIHANRVKLNNTAVVEGYFPSNTRDRGKCSIRGNVAVERKYD